MLVSTACEAPSPLVCKISSHLVARISRSMPIDHAFEEQNRVPKLKGAAHQGRLTHGVAKHVRFLPSQMIHQGQGVLRHDLRPVIDENTFFFQIKYSEPPPILTPPTHERVVKIIPVFLPHHSFSRESYCAMKRVQCGLSPSSKAT